MCVCEKENCERQGKGGGENNIEGESEREQSVIATATKRQLEQKEPQRLMDNK
jgi:hypothetical protein